MITLFDCLLSDFHWYRRRRAAIWYRVCTPVHPQITEWTMTVRDGDIVLNTEDHRTGNQATASLIALLQAVGSLPSGNHVMESPSVLAEQPRCSSIRIQESPTEVITAATNREP